MSLPNRRWLPVLAAGLIVLLPLLVEQAPVGATAPARPAAATDADRPTVYVSDEKANLRSGPNTDYDLVGVMVRGQEAPALGRSEAGLWLQIEYLGVPDGVAWVYSPLVQVNVPISSLPIIEPPPTPTPVPFPTLDPELVLSLEPTFGPTRLPTFTPAPPLAQATLLPSAGVTTGTSFPPVLAIVGFFVMGLFGAVVSFLRAGR